MGSATAVLVVSYLLLLSRSHCGVEIRWNFSFHFFSKQLLMSGVGVGWLEDKAMGQDWNGVDLKEGILVF